MSLCMACCLRLKGDLELCPHHHEIYESEWAPENRIWCDYFHSQKQPPRLVGAALQLLVPLALGAAVFFEISVEANEGIISLELESEATPDEEQLAIGITASVPGVGVVTAKRKEPKERSTTAVARS